MPSIQLLARDSILGHVLAHSSSARELRGTGTGTGLSASNQTEQSASFASKADVNIALAMGFLVLGILCVCGAAWRFALYRQKQKLRNRNHAGLVDLTAWVSEKTRDSDEYEYSSQASHTTRASSIYLDISRESSLDASSPPVPQHGQPSDGHALQGTQPAAISDGLLPPERAWVKPTLSVVTTFDRYVQEPRDLRVSLCSKPTCRADINDADVTPPPAYSFSMSYLGQVSAKERGTSKRQSSWIRAPPTPSPPPGLPVRVQSQAPQLPPIPPASNQVIYLSYDPDSRCRDRFSLREDTGAPTRPCGRGQA